jgi:acetyltransferase EpsM
MKKEFVLIGAGGHAKVIIGIIEEMGGTIQFINDTAAAITELHGYRVTKEMPEAGVDVIIAVGNNTVRKRIASQLNNPC